MTMHDQDEEVTNQTSSPTSSKAEAHPAEASGKARSAETARVLLRRAKRATWRRCLPSAKNLADTLSFKRVLRYRR